MKTQMLASWIPGLVLALAIVSASAAQEEQTTSTPNPLYVTGAMHPGPPVTNATLPAPNVSPALLSKPTSPVLGAAGVNRAAVPPKPYVSVWFTEILKLAQAGIPDRVMLSFIDSAGTFNLGADQIVQLRDLGVCDEAISAMMEHDFEIASGPQPLAATASLPFEPALPLILPSGDDAKNETKSQASGLVIVPSDTAAAVPIEVTGTVLGVSDDAVNGAGQRSQPPLAPGGLYPVRAPYSVRLTQPILFVNAPGRTPNLTVIQSFP
ncbi:MAG TPA: hypothetical protein VN578_00605 [Candidatus Binatia bacterium]|jgi:hypothetical protein|nr:hypothetical protein [Candidatus Binatia bacterium]